MASYDEILRAAANANAAGDTAAAQRLINFAASVRQPERGTVIVPGPDGERMQMQDAQSVPVPGPQRDNLTDNFRRFTGPMADATSSYGRAALGMDPSIVGESLPEDMPGRELAGRAGDAGMAALSGLGTVFAGAASAVGELGGKTPTQEAKLTRDLMMMGEVAVPQLAGASSVQRGAANAARAASKLEQPPTERQANARAASDIGVTPALGMAGKGRRMAAAGFEKVPIAGGMVAKDAARAVDEIAAASQRITEGIGQATNPTRAGEALQDGLGSYVETFKTRSAELYNQVGQHIPSDTMVLSNETRSLIANMLQGFEDKPEIASMLGLSRLSRLSDDLEGGLSWDGVRSLRSQIGKRKSGMNVSAVGDVNKGQLDQLYAALTRDLDAAAKEVGGEAAKSWERANRFYSRGATRIERDLDKLIKADNPERAFEAFAAMLKSDRATSDVRRVARIRSSMPKEEWRQVSASIVERLGKPTPGTAAPDQAGFSPSRFVTQWNGMPADAKALLVDEAARRELEKLARVSAQVKDANLERNFSNTGTVVTQAALFGGGATAPITTLSLLTAATVSARAMTSPRLLRAANKAARGDTRALKAIAGADTELRDDAQALLTVVSASQANGQEDGQQLLRAVQ